MDLREALQQISDIRRQMAQAEVFRGYRSLTVGFSGVLGTLAAVFQSRLIPNPQAALDHYLLLWVGVAAISLAVVGAELTWRSLRNGPGIGRETTRLAVEQLAPSLVVGALLTVCIFRGAPHVAWMLPGLWSLVFALGVFASYRLLPRQVSWVGSFFVVCGVFCLLFGQGARAFSP